MLGGLARRVAYVGKVQKESPRVLVVDSGDLFFKFSADSNEEKALTKARIIGRAYRYMGAAAVNVGCLDLIQGLDFLRQESAQGLPILSANLLHPSTKDPIFPPYMIKEIGGLRVGFIGLLPQESEPEISLAIRRANEGKLLIGEPVEAAKAAVHKVRDKADLIVLLSDLGLHRDQMLAKAVPGIHFILGGHEGRFTRKGIQTGKTHIFQSSSKGMYVGQLRLIIEDRNSPFKDEGELQYLQERIDNLDLHIRSLQAAKMRQPAREGVNYDRTIQAVKRQREAVQEDLKRAQESGIRGNRLNFKLETLEKVLPENEEMKKWIGEAGIEKD